MKYTTLQLRIFSKKIILLCSFLSALFASNLYASPEAEIVPSLSRVYNARFLGNVEQSPALGASGNLDATFSDTVGSVGSIDLTSQFDNSQAQAIVTLSNGDFLVALSPHAGSSSKLAKYNAQGVVLTDSYGVSGVVDLQAQSQNALTMMLDVQGRVLVAGGDDTMPGSSGWLSRVSTNGSVVESFEEPEFVDLNFVGGIAEQSTGEIIAVGRAVASGSSLYTAIIRYDLGGSVDASFGDAGVVIFDGTGNLPLSTTGAYSVVVDAQDRIYVPYVDDSNNVWVVRLTANGAIDLTWGTVDGIMVVADHGPISGTITPSSFTTSRFHSVSSLLLYQVAGTFTITGGSSIYTGTLTIDGFGSGPFNLDSGSFIVGKRAISYLNNATPATLRMATDGYGNLIIGAQVGTNILVTGITSTGIAISGFTNFNSTAINSDIFEMSNLITTMDDSILITAYNATTNYFTIIKLIGDGLSQAGELDTTFNTTGYNFFRADSGILDGNIYDVCLSPDGRIYTASAQFYAGVNFPYVSRLYNTLYDAQVAQSPATQEQGIADLTFGQNDDNQTYQGVVSPYLGNYRGNLQQEASVILEIAYPIQSGGSSGVGDLLVGGDGYTNASNLFTMMLTWLTPAGSIDTDFGTSGSGQLLLENESSTDEYLYAMTQGSSGAIYVAAQADNDLAVLRKYTATSTSNWTVGTSAWSVVVPAIPDYEAHGYGVALQQTNNVNNVLLLQGLYGNEPGISIGMISAYDANTGALSTTFGDGGSGYIYYNSFGLNMAQLYGAVINQAGDIFVAYGNSDTRDGNRGQIDVAAFKPDGSGLITEFGVNGVVSDVFYSSSQKFWNVNIATAATTGNILVSCCDNNHINVARLDAVTGNYDLTFNPDTEGSGAMFVRLRNTNIYSLQGLSDGSIMVTGYIEVEDAQMFMVRITQDGYLDETFNSQGTTPGIYLNQIGLQPSYFFGVAVQSTTDNVGNLVVVGSQSPTFNQSSPTIERIFGQPGTTAVKNYPSLDQYPGTLDLGLNGTGYQDLTDLIGAGYANIVFAYPADNEYEGMLLIAINAGATTSIVRINETYMTLDTTFCPGGSGIYTVTPNLTGVNCLSIDSNNNILVGGTNGGGAGAGWAQQITPDGTSAISFNLPATNIQVNAIGEQKSGRYIIAGQNIYTQNEIYAFQDQLVGSNDMLELDPTFNPLGGSTAPTGPLGCFVVGTVSGGIYTLVINSDDTILVGSQSGSSTNVQIAKIAANGSRLAPGFGDSGTGIALTPVVSDNPYSMRLVVDNDDNIIVAASGGDGLNVQVIRYTSSGVLDDTWNSGSVTTINSADIGTDVFLTSMLETATQQTILLGYNESDSPDGYLFAVRLDAHGILDTTWNPNGSTPGVLSFYLNSTWVMGVQAWIGISGNIWTASYGDSPNYHSSLIEIVGDTYVQQFPQAPLAAPAGTLDYTLDSSGALNLAMQLGYDFGEPAKLAILSDQSMIMAYNTDGLNIVKINPVLDLDTTFNASPNMGEVAGQVYVAVPDGFAHDLFVADAQDDTGTIYVTGGDSSMWAVKVSADGSSVTELTASTSLTLGGAIRQTPAGNIIVAGYAGSTGILAEFSADMASLNTSFGVSGYYTTAVDSPIYAMTVDDNGLIYIAYKQEGSDLLVVQRVFANGSGIDSAFDPNFTVPCSNQQQVCLQLDQVNNQLVVAAQGIDISYGDTVVYVHRYSTVDGSDTGGDVEIIIPHALCNLASLFIDTDQNIYVVGYTPSSTYTTFVGRIISTSSTTIELDTQNYAVDGDTPGIANVVAGPLTRSLTKRNGLAFMIAAGILDQDGRVYVAGLSGGHTAYMARLFGDNYYTQVSQAIPLISSGPATFDDTYGTNGIVTTSAGIVPSAGQVAFGILPIATGTNIMTLIANADGTQSWTARQLSDGSNDDTYTTGGPGNGIAIAQFNNGTELPLGMVFDGSGNSIVYGFNDPVGGFVKSILPSGAMNSAFNGIATSPAGTSYIAQFLVVNAVAQLSNGNFVCVGKNGQNIGVFGVLSPNGQPIDSLFQNFGTNISSVSIDAQDNIYLAVGSGSTASVVKLNSAGVVDTSYVANDVIADVYNTENVRLVLNAVGNIVIAASIVNGESGVIIQLVGLNSDGSIDTDFNQLLIPFATDTNGVLTSLVALQNGNLLLAGYQHDFDDSDNMDFEFVASVTSAGEFDTTFNPAGSPAGLLLFQVAVGEQEDRNLWAMSVQDNGRILLAGSEESMSSVATPLTMRLDGYPDVKAIPQFVGAVPVVPSLLNPAFNQTGIAFTQDITNLVDGGSTIVDSQSRVLIAGRTDTDPTFVVMRFLPDGTPDNSFGTNGIAQTPTLAALVSGSYVALDSDDNIYVGGVASLGTFVVARFLGTNGALDTEGFNTEGVGASINVPGVAQSYSVDNNVNNGGYVAIDYLGNVLVAGTASDSQIMVARFTSDGLIDSSYGPVVPGVTQSGTIVGLFDGGSIATPQSSLLFTDDNSCYVGGVVSFGRVNTLIAVKFDAYGYLDGSFGSGGIAQSTDISGLVDGGVLALDSNRKIVVGGFTNSPNKAFVAARFLSLGLFDPDFNGGVAYSSALTSLNSCLGICVDLNDNIVLGGTSTAYDGVSISMVIARMTSVGDIDTTLSTTGIASTGIIDGLVRGGFVATNLLNNPFIGGYDGTKLVVAEIYSGAEIFITNPNLLPPGTYKIYWFGNIPSLFQNYLAIPIFAEVVIDDIVRADLITKLQDSLDTYTSIYEGQPNLNLLANTTSWNNQFNQVRLLLLILHPESGDQINEFFTNFNARRFIIHAELAGVGSSL